MSPCLATSSTRRSSSTDPWSHRKAPASDKAAFSLLGTPVTESLAKRQWSASYLAMVQATEQSLENNRYLAGTTNGLVNWVGAQSVPTMLPPYAAAWIWYALKVAALAYLVAWLGRAVRVEAPGLARRTRVAYLALPFLLALNPFLSEFRLGQANLFVLLFSVLTVEALERGKPLRGALFFSLAAVKVTALALPLNALAPRRKCASGHVPPPRSDSGRPMRHRARTA